MPRCCPKCDGGCTLANAWRRRGLVAGIVTWMGFFLSGSNLHDGWRIGVENVSVGTGRRMAYQAISSAT